MTEIQKPITVARHDFMQQVIAEINKSQLPAFVVSEVLRDLIVNVDKIAKEQLEEDTATYRQMLQRIPANLPESTSKTQQPKHKRGDK